MKKIKLAKTFLNVGKIISIVMIPVAALLFISGIGSIIGGSFSEDEVELALGLSFGITNLVFGFILLPFAIVSLVLAGSAAKTLEKANNKHEANKAAVLALVAGVLLNTFSIVSAILIWTSKDTDYIIDVK